MAVRPGDPAVLGAGADAGLRPLWKTVGDSTSLGGYVKIRLSGRLLSSENTCSNAKPGESITLCCLQGQNNKVARENF